MSTSTSTSSPTSTSGLVRERAARAARAAAKNFAPQAALDAIASQANSQANIASGLDRAALPAAAAVAAAEGVAVAEAGSSLGVGGAVGTRRNLMSSSSWSWVFVEGGEQQQRRRLQEYDAQDDAEGDAEGDGGVGSDEASLSSSWWFAIRETFLEVMGYGDGLDPCNSRSSSRGRRERRSAGALSGLIQVVWRSLCCFILLLHI